MRRAALLLLIAFSAYGQTAKELFDRAQQLSKAGDGAAALQAYVEAVKADPSLESWDFINHVPGVIGQPAAAPPFQEALRMYLLRHPDKYSALFLLSQSYEFAKRLSDAEELWNAYLARHPRSVKAVFDRDRILEAEGKYDAVVAAHEKLVAAYPCDEHAVADLASTMLKTANRDLGKVNRAEQVARKALSMDPDYLGGMFGLIEILRAKASLDTGHAAAIKAEADALQLRWVALRREHDAAFKVRRSWDVFLMQESEDDPRLTSYSPFRPAEWFRREPFVIKVFEPDDVPLTITIAGDDKVARPLPKDAFQAKVEQSRGKKYTVTYAVARLNGVPIVNTKDCRIYVTVKRGADSAALGILPE